MSLVRRRWPPPAAAAEIPPAAADERTLPVSFSRELSPGVPQTNFSLLLLLIVVVVLFVFNESSLWGIYFEPLNVDSLLPGGMVDGGRGGEGRGEEERRVGRSSVDDEDTEQVDAESERSYGREGRCGEQLTKLPI